MLVHSNFGLFLLGDLGGDSFRLVEFYIQVSDVIVLFIDHDHV